MATFDTRSENDTGEKHGRSPFIRDAVLATADRRNRRNIQTGKIVLFIYLFICLFVFPSPASPKRTTDDRGFKIVRV